MNSIGLWREICGNTTCWYTKKARLCGQEDKRPATFLRYNQLAPEKYPELQVASFTFYHQHASQSSISILAIISLYKALT